MRYYIQNNTADIAHVFNGIGAYCSAHNRVGFCKEMFSVIEHLNGRKVCKKCIENLPKFLKKRFTTHSVKLNKKDKKRRRISQVERLPKFSDKPETVDFNHAEWPVSVKTGKRMTYAFIVSGKFLKSFDWLRVRMHALANTDGRCECCGATSKDGALLNVDHVRPRKYFPQIALSLHNLQVLCHDCNFGKGNDYMIHWKTL